MSIPIATPAMTCENKHHSPEGITTETGPRSQPKKTTKNANGNGLKCRFSAWKRPRNTIGSILSFQAWSLGSGGTADNIICWRIELIFKEITRYQTKTFWMNCLAATVVSRGMLTDPPSGGESDHGSGSQTDRVGGGLIGKSLGGISKHPCNVVVQMGDYQTMALDSQAKRP